MQVKKIIAAVAVLGVFAMASHPARAGVIQVTYSGSANFGSGPVGYASGQVAPNPNSNTNLVSVGIGGDSFTTANTTYDFSSTGQFNAWCVDIYHWLSGGTVTYNVGTATDLATDLSALRQGTGTVRVNQLIQLANQVYSSVDTKTESAAFQLAVWAIAFGTADQSGIYHINTTDPGFRVNSSTVSSAYGVLANQWLANLNSAPTSGNYSLTYLNDGLRAITQDVIVFTAIPPFITRVPEPGMIALFSLGFAGLGFMRRGKA